MLQLKFSTEIVSWWDHWRLKGKIIFHFIIKSRKQTNHNAISKVNNSRSCICDRIFWPWSWFPASQGAIGRYFWWWRFIGILRVLKWSRAYFNSGTRTYNKLPASDHKPWRRVLACLWSERYPPQLILWRNPLSIWRPKCWHRTFPRLGSQFQIRWWRSLYHNSTWANRGTLC